MNGESLLGGTNRFTNHRYGLKVYSGQPSTNRYISVPGFSASYDANGNVLSDPTNTFSWDAEGHAVTVDSVAVTYDAMGRAVERNAGGAYSQIVYAPNGAKIAVMNGQALQKAFVPLAGGSMAIYNSSGLAYYRHADWLGSSRLASTSGGPVPGKGSVTIGGPERTVCARYSRGRCVLTAYDSGTVTATVNGFPAQVSYGATSTSGSIALSLAAAINQATNTVLATASGSVITIVAAASGASTNYTLAGRVARPLI